MQRTGARMFDRAANRCLGAISRREDPGAAHVGRQWTFKVAVANQIDADGGHAAGDE